MVGILDNKKTSELLIQINDTTYEKINPETLAEVVSVKESVDENVQEHIENKDIHFSKSDFENLTSDSLKVTNIIAGNNITITQEDGTNNIMITASDHPTDGFLKKSDIQAEDDSITVIPSEDSNVVKIKANIPNIPELKETLKKENIKAGNENITVTYDNETNDVYISSDGKLYSAGVGIQINDNVIENILPDQEVILTAGDNIQIDGTYPTYTITASSGATIDDWEENKLYFKGQFLVYQNSIYRCNTQHTSGSQFEPVYWDLIAGYKINKFFYLDNDAEITNIILPNEIPNKEVLTINVGGIILQSQNYELNADRKTVTFYVSIPKGEIIEVSVANNEVINEFDNGANIFPWKPYQSYAINNMVIYENVLHQCLENHISGLEFDEDKWEVIAGYTKDVLSYPINIETNTIILPYTIIDKNNVMINKNGLILQSSEYSLKNDFQTIQLKSVLQPSDVVEVTIFSNSILQQLDIPMPYNHPHEFLRSAISEDSYELITADEVKQQLGLSSFTNYIGNSQKVIRVNKDESDIEFMNLQTVSGEVGIRRMATGLNGVLTKVDGEDYITINNGSIMSDDGLVLMELKQPLTKNLGKAFYEGNHQGSCYEFGGDDWTQPIMTSYNTPYGQVIAEEEQTEREAWRAMDEYTSEGNGWLADKVDVKWSYQTPEPLYVQSIDFYGQESYLDNRPKDIDIIVGGKYKQSFIAPNENIVHVHVDIENPEWSNVFTLHFKSSYGRAVGMKHIVINALYPTYISKNTDYEMYLISNDDASKVDLITSYNKSFTLPEGYTKKAKIGSYRSDKNKQLFDVYPTQDLATTFINGVGKINENSLETWMNNGNDVAVKVIEQWGETTPNNGYIQFPIEYSTKCFYVNANGRRVSEITNNSFRVEGTDTVFWNAKGY